MIKDSTTERLREQGALPRLTLDQSNRAADSTGNTIGVPDGCGRTPQASLRVQAPAGQLPMARLCNVRDIALRVRTRGRHSLL